MPHIAPVPYDAPLSQGTKLVPWDEREGVEKVEDHIHRSDRETLWSPPQEQTRIPQPGNHKVPVAKLAGDARIKKHARQLAQQPREPW